MVRFSSLTSLLRAAIFPAHHQLLRIVQQAAAEAFDIAFSALGVAASLIAMYMVEIPAFEIRTAFYLIHLFYV